MINILLATENKSKVRELKAIEQNRYYLLDLSYLNKKVFWEETGSTFYENALIKAKAVKALTDLPVLGEDSGLVVEDLGGAPGVFSKRFFGEGGTDKDNIQKLLEKLNEVKSKKRRAYFITSLVYLDEKGRAQSFEGKCHGKILEAPRGTEGFGYDPIFLPDGYTKSFAELDISIKNRVSHRFKAFEAFLNFTPSIK